MGQHLSWSTAAIGYYTSIYGAGIIIGGRYACTIEERERLLLSRNPF